MGKITKFDKQALRDIRTELKLALAPVEEKFGLSFNVGNMTFSETSFRVKLECGIDNGDGVDAVEKHRWDTYCFRYDLKPEDFGRTFYKFDGTAYEIVGCSPKSSKYSILAKNMSNGKIYKFPIHNVVDGLKLKGKIKDIFR